MSQAIKMFHRSIATCLIVNNDGSHSPGGEVASNYYGRDVVLLDLREWIDLREEPVRHYNHAFHAALQQHVKISLELLPAVVGVHDDRQVGSGIESLLDATQQRHTERIGDIKDQNADRMAAATAQRASKRIRMVPHLERGLANVLLRLRRDMAGKRRVIQHD